MEKFSNIKSVEEEVVFIAQLVSQRDTTQQQISHIQIMHHNKRCSFFFPEIDKNLDIDCTDLIEEFQGKLIELLNNRIQLGLQKISQSQDVLSYDQK